LAAAAVTAAAVAPAAVAEKQNNLIAAILARLDNPVEPAKRPDVASDDDGLEPTAKRQAGAAGSSN
jgi:hypothetical protein